VLAVAATLLVFYSPDGPIRTWSMRNSPDSTRATCAKP